MLICPIILDKFEKTTEMSKIYPNTRVKQFSLLGLTTQSVVPRPAA